MVAGRWVLVLLTVLVGPLMWWAGVSDTAAAAYDAVPPGDASLPYFISNYEEPGHFMALAFGAVHLMLIAVLMPTARRLRRERVGTFVQAIVASLLAFCFAWAQYVLNPVTTNWGGDPDGWSLVKDHIAAWYGEIAFLWLVLVGLTAVTIAVSALVAARLTAEERVHHRT
jgi:hypothetical protein